MNHLLGELSHLSGSDGSERPAPPATISIPAAVRGRTSGYTVILTLAAPPERVFGELADIESLPRWAGAFCEQVYLVRGRWAALTSLGELFLALEANPRAGDITLWAGWSEARLHALPLRVGATDSGGTRVTFVAQVADEEQARLCRALGDTWPGLVARLDGAALPGAAWRGH